MKTISLLALLAACGGETDNSIQGADYLLIANLTDSAFVQTLPTLDHGTMQDNLHGVEVGIYAYAEVIGKRVYVTQNLSSDQVLSFDVVGDGLQAGPTLQAPTQSYPADIVSASATKAYLTLTNAGVVDVIDPTTLVVQKTIDLNGNAFPDPDDKNPDPSSMVIRDGKLFVALWNTKSQFTARPGVAVAVIDVATDKLDKVITDTRGLAGAGRPGEDDAMRVDEKGDIYVYASGGFSLDPTLHHGFLRIAKGATDFDASYLWDLSATHVDVQGGSVDFCNSMRYYHDGIMICAANVPPLNSNPPDFIHDYPYQILSLDLRNKTASVLPIPLSNASAGGAMELDGDTLIVSLATADQIGLFTHDLVTHQTSDGADVTTQGWISLIRKL